MRFSVVDPIAEYKSFSSAEAWPSKPTNAKGRCMPSSNRSDPGCGFLGKELGAKLCAANVALSSCMSADDLNDGSFYKFFNQTKLNNLRKKRAIVKEVMEAMNLHSTGDDIQGTTEIQEARRLLATSKFQTVKWGMLCFVLNKDIITMTKSGNDLRIKLKEIWQLNRMDKEFTGYLGQDLVTQLEELTDPKYRASHALAELPSAATGKGQKRKGLAAVVGKQKKGERFAGMVPGTI